MDLFVLEKAVQSAHPRLSLFFLEVLKNYRTHAKGADNTLARLDAGKDRDPKEH